MAILETDTQNYYKVNFDECMIKGNGVYVSFGVYKTQQDRFYEKERHPLIAQFMEKMLTKSNELYANLISEVDKLGIPYEEIISSEDPNLIDSNRFPLLRKLQNELHIWQIYPNKIYERCYRYDETNLEPLDINLMETKFASFGFKKEWIEKPIHIKGMATTFCGEYKGEKLNNEFFYSRLKTVMSDRVVNC